MARPLMVLAAANGVLGLALMVGTPAPAPPVALPAPTALPTAPSDRPGPAPLPPLEPGASGARGTHPACLVSCWVDPAPHGEPPVPDPVPMATPADPRAPQDLTDVEVHVTLPLGGTFADAWNGRLLYEDGSAVPVHGAPGSSTTRVRLAPGVWRLQVWSGAAFEAAPVYYDGGGGALWLQLRASPPLVFG